MDHIYEAPQFGENWFTFQKLYSEVVKEFPDGSIFAEVGSWKGKSSAYMAVEIANSNKNIRFYCVDTWEGSVEHKDREDLKSLYDTFISNMAPVENYYTPMQMSSLKAARIFTDEIFDFVFIDASHQYEDVIEDIKAWYPKVKKGGIIAGHDYYQGGDAYGFGVHRAVNEYFPNGNFTSDPQQYTWMHRK